MWDCTCSKVGCVASLILIFQSEPILLDVFQAEEVYNEVSTLPADEWANIVLQELQESGGDLSKVTQLGSHYLTHLVIACMRVFGWAASLR